MKHKRGRSAAEEDEDEQFESHMRELNAEFLEDCQKLLKNDPTQVLDDVCNRYVRNAEKIRVRTEESVKRSKELSGEVRANGEQDKTAGELYVWGTGDSGQLGLGENVDEKRTPTLVERGPMAGVKVAAVACGGTHTIALGVDGTCYSWGNNDGGVLGREVDLDRSPYAEYEPGIVDLPTCQAVVAISTGDSHALALSENGTVYAWGAFRTANGEWAFNPLTLDQKKTTFPFEIYVPQAANERATAIDSGVDHALALTQEGGVLSWGCSEKGRLGRVSEAEAEENEKAGDELKSRLLTPTRVKFPSLVPDPMSGTIGTASSRNQPKICAIIAGDYHSFGVSMNDDGNSTVYGWGLSNYNQIGVFDGSESVRGCEQVRYFPEQINCLTGRSIMHGSAATHHSLFITTAGEVIAVGRWTDGRCGVRVNDAAIDGQLEKPQKVEDLPETAVKISCGGTNGGAILRDGSAYVWGSQYTAQLGLGSREKDAHLPEKLDCTATCLEGKAFYDISFGGQHAAAILITKQPETPNKSKRARLR